MPAQKITFKKKGGSFVEPPDKNKTNEQTFWILFYSSFPPTIQLLIF